MKKLIASLFICVAVALAAAPLTAADKPADKPAAPAKGEKKGPRSLPFRGKVGAIDKDAKVITVGERKFHVTATTKFVKAGKPATLADAAVGDEVGGAYRESDSGKMELVSLRIGPKPEEKK